MAIVPNKDGQGIHANGFNGVVDVSYCVPTTYASGVPSTAATFASEIRADSATGDMYRALAAGGTQWVDAC